MAGACCGFTGGLADGMRCCLQDVFGTIVFAVGGKEIAKGATVLTWPDLRTLANKKWKPACNYLAPSASWTANPNLTTMVLMSLTRLIQGACFCLCLRSQGLRLERSAFLQRPA